MEESSREIFPWSDSDCDWNLTLPPSRPSGEILDYFRAALSSLEYKRTAAVLGSTPELRDLLVELGFQKIFVFERSSKSYHVFSRLRSHATRELVVWGDWVNTIPRYVKTFDAICGDLISGNIPFELQNEFYASVFGSLNHGGAFCERVICTLSPLLPIQTIISEFSCLPVNLFRLTTFVNKLFFLSDALADKEFVDVPSLIGEYRKMSQSVYFNKFLDLVPSVLPKSGRWYYSANMPDVGLPFHSRYSCKRILGSRFDSIFGDRTELRTTTT